MLTLECISFQYSQQAPALHEVSLELKAADFMALAGHNGSGKTTLTRLIMGLIKPTGGRILLDDEDLARHSTAQRARHIGYVFQNPDRQIFRDTVALEVAYGPSSSASAPQKQAKPSPRPCRPSPWLIRRKQTRDFCPKVSSSASPLPPRWL